MADCYNCAILHNALIEFQNQHQIEFDNWQEERNELLD